MTKEKYDLLKKLFKERNLTLHEIAEAVGVSFHTFRIMRTKLGLTQRYVKKFKPQQEITPEELAERTAEVKAKALAHKKEFGRPEFVPSKKPGYKFCAKNFKYTTFET